MILFFTFIILFIIMFLLMVIIDSALKNEPSVKRWFITTLIFTVVIFLTFLSFSLF
ncbi:hypothetical protein ACE1TH_01360 [Shouchella sp. JSM 1781072]|uniref:hypothetical protein n=1 Tax=Bacillaceae TaxID=186817 RepID=UPI00159B89C1|nr:MULTISPECIES: hypothetical protein [Bacillaceae]UTR05467.1 hypothetical protein MM326_15325 [Alkalihalobacillus sp. LMS6]